MAEIVVCDISKKFGQQVVLDHISMKLSSPHIYGLVGRNGHTRLTLHQNHKKIISMLRSASI